MRERVDGDDCDGRLVNQMTFRSLQLPASTIVSLSLQRHNRRLRKEAWNRTRYQRRLANQPA